MQTMARKYRSTLTNLTQNFDPGKCKLIFDDQPNGTKGKNNNKKAHKMDNREATCQSENERNFFTFMTVMIIIPYILYNVSSGLSALSIFLCTVFKPEFSV